MAPMKTRPTALVLAAGSGSRFGGGKLLAPLHGKPLLQHVLDRVAEAGLGEAVVVLGHDADAVEHAIAWRAEKLVRNAAPERGLASSLQAGMAALDPTADAVLILLGDQPLVAIETIHALLDAPSDSERPIVVPAYGDHGDDGDHGGRNPVLLQRAAFALANEATGDRGLGPVLEAHPELVVGVPIPGANPDIDTREDLARIVEASWAARVRANREQVERIREVPDETDFYAPVQSLFRSDPTRIDDPVLLALVDLIRPGETWLDVGAGAGRFALPIARALDPSGGSVLALDASPSMLESLREIADDYAIENVRTIEARWPLADPSTLESDVTLIAHVGYDIDAIGAFVDGLETAARRVCVAVLMERVPASAADPFWPRVHGEPRVALPALPDFVELLRARGREPLVTDIVIEPRHLESRGALESFVRRQLWIDPAGPKEAAFQAAVDELAVRDADGWTIRDRASNNIGIVMWTPPG
jgi:CTP:molybdopterin cytidylyltransferase MocA/SAM-dependent methyltransferase